MTPKKYLELKEQTEAQISALQQALKEALIESFKAPLPELRKAEAKDIVLGAILWYHCGPDEMYPNEWGWFEVEEVLRPGDDWKAFLSDGCRHGLFGAFVPENTTDQE